MASPISSQISTRQILVLSAYIISLFNGIGCVAACAQAQVNTLTKPGAKSVTLTLTSVQTRYSAQEPVIVDLHVLNESDQTVNYTDDNSALDNQVFTLTDAVGDLVPLTAYGKQLLKPYLARLNHSLPQAGIYRPYHVHLQPGQQATYHVWLNRVFDLSMEGDYTISATKPILDGTGNFHPIAATPLKIAITSPKVAPYSERGLPDEAEALYIEKYGSSLLPNRPLYSPISHKPAR